MSRKTTNSIPITAQLRIRGQKLVPLIVGGIGPLSHIDFERLLLRANKEAKSDQDHPGYLLLNATEFPDRTLALKKEQEGDGSLARQVEEKIVYFDQWAQTQGFDFMVFVCNTIHNWYQRVEGRLPIPWIHMMRITAQEIKNRYPQVNKVDVLATDGTLMGRLYHDALIKVGLEPIDLGFTSSVQQTVMGVIYDPEYGVKATQDVVSDRARKDLIKAADFLKKKGAEAIIAGCTEVSVVLSSGVYRDLPIIDPLQVLGRVTVDLAMGKRKLG